MKATATRESLNQRGSTVDAEILSYLRACADRNQGWASPSLTDVARMGRTSSYVVQESLCRFTRTGTVVEEVRIINGVEQEGWTIPGGTERRRHPKMAAAGFGSGDRNFLHSCGILQED